MFTLRPSSARGHANHGWLNTKHSFSFGHYYDPQHMGFRALRVINEDIVAPGQGFGEHPHDNMEIVSYVLSGALAHKDSLGSVKTLSPGEVQRMSAGTGIEHSEFNASSTEPAHFLQIWLKPAARNAAPGYEQKAFRVREEPNRLHLLASPDAADGSVHIGQDVRLYAASLSAGASVHLALAPGRHAWIQVARGRAHLNDINLSQGDGVAISDETALTLTGVASGPGGEQTEILLFDLN